MRCVKIPAVHVEVEEESAVSFIIAEGRLLAGAGEQLFKQELERLLEEGKKHIVVDFSRVPSIDSSVLGHLVHAYSILKKAGGDLKLLNPSQRIVDLLSLTRLLPIFEIYDTRQAAIASWKTADH